MTAALPAIPATTTTPDAAPATTPTQHVRAAAHGREFARALRTAVSASGGKAPASTAAIPRSTREPRTSASERPHVRAAHHGPTPAHADHRAAPVSPAGHDDEAATSTPAADEADDTRATRSAHERTDGRAESTTAPALPDNEHDVTSPVADVPRSAAAGGVTTLAPANLPDHQGAPGAPAATTVPEALVAASAAPAAGSTGTVATPSLSTGSLPTDSVPTQGTAAQSLPTVMANKAAPVGAMTAMRESLRPDVPSAAGVRLEPGAPESLSAAEPGGPSVVHSVVHHSGHRPGWSLPSGSAVPRGIAPIVDNGEPVLRIPLQGFATETPAIPAAPSAPSAPTSEGAAAAGEPGPSSSADAAVTLAAPTSSASATPTAAAPTTSAATLPATIATEVHAHLRTVHRTAEGGHATTLVISAEGLGRVRVELSTLGSTVDLVMHGGDAAAQDALRDALPHLRASLAESGLVVGSTDVADLPWTSSDRSGTPGRGRDAAPTRHPEVRETAPTTTTTRPDLTVRTSTSAAVDLLV